MLRVLVKLASLIAEPSEVQWKLDLADTDLAENLDLKDTLQKKNLKSPLSSAIEVPHQAADQQTCLQEPIPPFLDFPLNPFL